MGRGDENPELEDGRLQAREVRVQQVSTVDSEPRRPVSVAELLFTKGVLGRAHSCRLWGTTTCAFDKGWLPHPRAQCHEGFQRSRVEASSAHL